MSAQTEEIFNDCLEEMEKGKSVEEVLEKYPEHREELRGLLAIAKEIENARLPRVRDEAVASCLVKVHNALHLRENPEPGTESSIWQWLRSVGSPSPAWAKALAFMLIAALAFWGAVDLSGNSLPGDLLYPVKLTAENVRFSLATDAEARTTLRLAYAQTRTQELVSYVNEKGELNPRVLKAMMDETALAADSISKLPGDEAAAYCLRLEHHCAYQRDVLATLASRVPQPQRQELNEAIRLCHHRMEWMGKVRRNEVPMGEWGPFALDETKGGNLNP